jgi:F-type H+-transporting ATPase subunit gamma
MGVSGKAIKQKIKSVGNIKKITKTMEMVSVSKMKKATENVYRGRAYSRYALELLSNLASAQDITHPLLENKEEKRNLIGKELILVISSNKGLAGSYNTNISKALSSYKNSIGGKIDVVAVGKFSEKAARRNSLNIVASFVDFSEKTNSFEFIAVRDVLVKLFLEENYDRVSILFTELKSSISYRPYLMQLVPVVPEIYRNLLLEQEKEIKTDTLKLYKFEPDKEKILNEIIPQIIGAGIYHSFLESVSSEHSARMFAMKNAGDNAKSILEDLTLYYNQARQAAITQEISEIVGGAAAV